MPSTYDLKQKLSDMLRPFTSWLVRRGVTANGVTWAAIWLSLIYGGLLYFMPANKLLFLLFPWVLLLRMALNNIDGVIAREHDQITPLGGYLNELGDIVGDLVLYLPFARVAGFLPEVVLLFVLSGVVGEFAGVLSHAQGKARCYKGPITKSDRALAMSLLAIAVYFGLNQPLVINGILGTLSLLSLFTIKNRVRFGVEEIPGQSQAGPHV